TTISLDVGVELPRDPEEAPFRLQSELAPDNLQRRGERHPRGGKADGVTQTDFQRVIELEADALRRNLVHLSRSFPTNLELVLIGGQTPSHRRLAGRLGRPRGLIVVGHRRTPTLFGRSRGSAAPRARPGAASI